MPQASMKTITESSTSNPLGKLFAIAWRAYAEQRPAYEQACERHAQLFAKRIRDEGLRLFTKGNFAEQSSRAFDETEVEAGCTETLNEATSEAVNDTIQKIWAMEPKTLADLANLANVLASIEHEAWEQKLEDLDWELIAMRRLVEGVLRVAGEPLVLENLPIPQVVANPWQQAREGIEHID